MKKEVTVEYDDIVLVLVGDYQKGQDGSYMHPDISSDFNCHQVFSGGQDIIDILQQNIIEELEEEAVKNLEEVW
tara:strand:- start:422 stop:643 length:222 start_codon:yes stop_codon:yes gene_type:complete